MYTQIVWDKAAYFLGIDLDFCVKTIFMSDIKMDVVTLNFYKNNPFFIYLKEKSEC